MFIDARSLPDDAGLLWSDVCIVGSGPAGLALARELVRSRLTVNIIEAGDMEGERATQNLYTGENMGRSYYPLDSTRLRRSGGTSGHWWNGVQLRSLEFSTVNVHASMSGDLERNGAPIYLVDADADALSPHVEAQDLADSPSGVRADLVLVRRQVEVGTLFIDPKEG